MLYIGSLKPYSLEAIILFKNDTNFDFIVLIFEFIHKIMLYLEFTNYPKNIVLLEVSLYKETLKCTLKIQDHLSYR